MSPNRPEVPARIGQSVPFLAVSDMQAALKHYVDGLGFHMKNRWEQDGAVRWCWLEHGSPAGGGWPGGVHRAALMMQQYRTRGKNARVFHGRRGEGTAFALTEADTATGAALAGKGPWPFGTLASLVDDDGYEMLVSRDLLQSGAPTGAPLSHAVPVLSVSDIARSRAFYVDKLAFEEVDRLETKAGLSACRLRRDEAVLVLRQEDAPPARRGQGVSLFHLCDDALLFYREMLSRGVEVTEPFVGNGLWSLSVRDPDGYHLSFESPTDAPEEKTLTEVTGGR